METLSKKVSVIIPSLDPDEKLAAVVDSLVNAGFEDIILVNDGSSPQHMQPFESLSAYPQCTVLNHAVNRGKGRALKTAFEYILDNRPEAAGVVTVDGDNQHKAADIFRICERMLQAEDKVILGVRNFKGKDVPFKSRFGNNMTSFVFRFACGLNISDTQTGLRAIPREYLKLFCNVEGERFEYETNMLLELKQSRIGFEEVPIETVYIEENASTHFNPIVDSIKIYGVILKFLFSSFAAACIDLIMFAAINIILGKMADSVRIFVATAGARAISSLFNYTFNRKAVFRSKNSVKSSMAKYYVLCVIQMCVSYGLVYLVSWALSLGHGGTVAAKAVIDALLFLASFQIQQ